MSREYGADRPEGNWRRRDVVRTLGAVATLPRWTPRRTGTDRSAPPIPSAAQLLWQRDERALFVHFGVNTFSNREWGDGREAPDTFAPSALDARQWARVARRTGFRAMILTAKHHDGFCLWPTATTSHSVAASPFRGGAGDVVAEFVAACRAEGLRAGLYLSPWDRSASSYGDSARYNDFYVAQLTELLSRYGPLHEIWFDGANGEGPGGRRQQYDWPRYWATVRRLQPDAVIFSDAGPDIRWIGNERGSAGETNWSTVDPRAVTVPGMSGDAVTRQLQQGDPDGTVWRPGETDVSIRPGWFWHPEQDDAVRPASDLVDLFFSSVGRNSKLLLNVPPTTAGLLHDRDVAHLEAMHAALERQFAASIGAAPSWRSTGPNSGVALVADLPERRPIGIIDLAEPIASGQRVAGYVVEAATPTGWREIARGTTIGYRRLHRVAPITARAIRVRVDQSVAPLEPLSLRLFAP
jgi:alpha-L-fucosidase